MTARGAASVAPMAAAAVTSASAVSEVMFGGTLQRLVDTGGVLEMLVAAESTPFELHRVPVNSEHLLAR